MATVSDGSLRRLVDLRPGVPVLSLYLDLDPSQFATQAARASAIRSLLDHAHRRIEAHPADHAGRVSLRAGLARAETFFEEEFSAKGSRGFAVFSAEQAGVFETIGLDRPTRTQVVINHTPYVEPLLQAGDPRDWIIALVDRRHTRLLCGNQEHLEEVEWRSDPVPGRHDQGGWEQDHRQRHIDEKAERHLRRTAQEIQHHLDGHPQRRVVLGGPHETVLALEGLLGEQARRRLAGHIEVEVQHSTTDDVRRAALEVFENDERRRERDALDRLKAGVATHGRGAAGLDPVQDALVQRRVEILLYEDGWEPPGEFALEDAVEEAIAQDAEVLAVRHFPDLGPLGHIGAVLRF
jgi:peptide subunit release factor 1 (eRF1)